MLGCVIFCRRRAQAPVSLWVPDGHRSIEPDGERAEYWSTVPDGERAEYVPERVGPPQGCPRHRLAGQQAGPHEPGERSFHCGCCAGTCEICRSELRPRASDEPLKGPCSCCTVKRGGDTCRWNARRFTGRRSSGVPQDHDHEPWFVIVPDYRVHDHEQRGAPAYQYHDHEQIRSRAQRDQYHESPQTIWVAETGHRYHTMFG
ncbi:hypothetical protein N9L68_04550 [bacterium]|nr:hypothetical protein [bacterium]